MHPSLYPGTNSSSSSFEIANKNCQSDDTSGRRPGAWNIQILDRCTYIPSQGKGKRSRHQGLQVRRLPEADVAAIDVKQPENQKWKKTFTREHINDQENWSALDGDKESYLKSRRYLGTWSRSSLIYTEKHWQTLGYQKVPSLGRKMDLTAHVVEFKMQ